MEIESSKTEQKRPDIRLVQPIFDDRQPRQVPREKTEKQFEFGKDVDKTTKTEIDLEIEKTKQKTKTLEEELDYYKTEE